MFSSKTNPASSSLLLIFVIQIILILLMGGLFAIGYRNHNMGSFWFALILGSLGASISLMRRINTGKADFITASTEFKILSTLMPILYGTIMTGIAYLLFMSGILSGENGGGLITTNIFPNFDKTGAFGKTLMEQFLIIHPYDIKEAGKLFVWCFITGYSEKFITGVLSSMEGRVLKEEEPAEEKNKK